MLRRILFLFAGLLVPPAWGADLDLSKLPPAAGHVVDFVKEVQPILAGRCYACHGTEKQKSNYRLDVRAYALKGGDIGRPIVAGDSAHSPLVQYVGGVHPEIVMPPKGEALSAAQVGVIRAWIDQGAKWPANADSIKVADRADWWSLKPIVRPAVPVLADSHRLGRERNVPPLADARQTGMSAPPKEGVATERAGNPIDAFILAKLAEKNLTPAREADPRTLIRRVYFDLIGLPPSPEEVAAFVKDPDPAAYEKLVDKLLASPRYGETWGRHWLDAVHYGDTHGYDKDKVRPHAWPYRDYVIRSLNSDKPYARFVKEQLAGDAFYPHTDDGILGLGFIAAGPWDFVGQVELREGTIDKAITRNLDRDDIVSVTMNTFVSLTAQCARCHNHKFDPILQEDYYSLQACFAGVDRGDRVVDENKAAAGRRPEFGYHSAISTRQDAVKWVQVDLGKAVAIERIVGVGAHDTFNNIGAGFGFPLRYKVEASEDADFKAGVVMIADRTMEDVKNPGVVPQVIAAGGKRGRYVRITATKLAPRQNDFIFALGELSVMAADGKNLAMGKPVTALDSIEAPVRWGKANLVDGYFYREADASAGGGAAGVVYAALPVKPRPVYLLHRGSEKQPEKEMGPGTVSLSYVPALASRFGDAKLPEKERRAALAAWIVSEKNPLTWRSIVNRVWQYHFGRGIVETPNDFGHMGAIPTHPELLDWLAAEFRDGGTFLTAQSIKSLQRLIVTSATYRQSCANDDKNAAIDSGNQFLWRMNRTRLDAEDIRDSVLSVAGKLDLKMGGPGFRDFGFKDDHSPHYAYGEYDPEDVTTQRRSVYRLVVRSVPDPFMETLDCADPSQMVARRNETLTPLQALALLNNPFMVKMAEHFAARVEKSAADNEGRIDAACWLAYGRGANDVEKKVLGEMAAKYGMASVCRVILNANEFVFVD